MKDNKLIAEFMGIRGEYNEDEKVVYLESDIDGRGVYAFSDMKYHTSWDWLIPVMKKIDSYACEEMDFSDYDDYRNKYVFIHNISLHNDIREVYNQVVEFIKQLSKES